jgi:AcrR family transcriptional regulator
MADGRIETDLGRQSRLPVDGRHRRSAQSRQRILDALMALLADGETRPSADQLAERAGVGRRTVFRLFSDMESIYAEMHAAMRSALHRDAQDLDDEPEGLRALVARRVRLYEAFRPLHAAAAAHRTEGGAVEQAHRALVADLRRDLARSLPHEGADDPALLDGLEALLSPDVWSRLRHEQKLDRDTATQVLIRMVDVLEP